MENNKIIIKGKEYTEDEFYDLPIFIQREYYDSRTQHLSDFELLRELRKRLDKYPSKVQYTSEMLENWFDKKEWKTDKQSIKKFVESNLTIERGMDLNYGDPTSDYFAEVKWKSERFNQYIDDGSLAEEVLNKSLKAKPIELIERLEDVINKLVQQIVKYEKKQKHGK